MRRKWFRREWLWILAGLTGSTALAAYLFDQTDSRTAPSSLSLREEAGQLTISWSPTVTVRGATLEILDGRRRTTLLVTAPLAAITYAAESADVQIRLTPSGDGQVETARYLVQEPPIAHLKVQFATALAETRALQASLRRQEATLSNLESQTQMLARRTQPHAPAKKPAPTVIQWWR